MSEIYKLLNTRSKSDLETQSLGKKFSNYIKPGNIFSLSGNLGSGKTTFMKGVLKGLEYEGEVTSPTYTLINEYRVNYNIIHIDCYREKDIQRWLNIGITDYFNGDNILFIEWAENIKILLPDYVKSISFEVLSNNKRYISYNE